MSELDRVTITKVESAVLVGRRPRWVGRNSYGGPAGRVVREPVVRLQTDAGAAGWGWSPAGPKDARRLVGNKVGEVFEGGVGTSDEFLMFDFPMWDLAGRLSGRSVHATLGDAGPDPVPVYDGSIYIDELDPETGRDDGVGPMLDAVRMGMEAGFRAFKVKVGRGDKWMGRGAGLKRDVEVLHAIRDLIGPEMKLLIDANNGYTLEEARSVMDQAGECDIFWFEEPFPESLEDCGAFKRHIQDGGWRTLVADGESHREHDEAFTEIVRSGAIDVVQFDLRYYTLTRWLRYMPVIEKTGSLAAPHNWGSHLSGFYISHFARGLGYFAMGETDPMEMPGVLAEGYHLADSMMSVPDSPGFGLELAEDAFEEALTGDEAWAVEADDRLS